MARIGRVVAGAMVVALLLSACSLPGQTPTLSKRIQTQPTPTSTSTVSAGTPQGYSPQQLRAAYGVNSLLAAGSTGAGQTVVVIESFGSPTLQRDLDSYDQQFGLPPLTVRVIAPLGTVSFNPGNADMAGWAGETDLDVEMIHAIAPGANIVVLTSPVSETEGTIGLPEFFRLEQYALDHHLGNIISMSFGASEATLTDGEAQRELAQWDAFFKQATTTQGISFLASSGDGGATDVTDLQGKHLASTPTIGFPGDDPWVTAVGGTTLSFIGGTPTETAWSRSEGGFSQVFAMPAYQQTLSAATRQPFAGRRGVPDVAACADPKLGVSVITLGHWQVIGGTSAAAPIWAALGAIADQLAGRPLGFLNPALYTLGTQPATATRDFRDVTVGNNSVHTAEVTVTGYSAAPGWDAVTGLGAPIAEKLLPDLVAATR